jgi:hypothetical protein
MNSFSLTSGTKQLTVKQAMSLESTINQIPKSLSSRNPSDWLEWAYILNKNAGSFPLSESYDDLRTIKALCILIAQREIELTEFIQHLINFDCVGPLDSLPPMLSGMAGIMSIVSEEGFNFPKLPPKVGEILARPAGWWKAAIAEAKNP